MAVSISAGAATIEAARIQEEIPINPSDVFWSNYGPLNDYPSRPAVSPPYWKH